MPVNHVARIGLPQLLFLCTRVTYNPILQFGVEYTMRETHCETEDEESDIE
jgi:hypothetical protein